IPVALISTRTSPAFGPSRSSSTISSGFFAWKATAARVFILNSILTFQKGWLERDDFSSNRHPALSFFEHDLSEKPVPTFPDHALERLATTPRAFNIIA